jgi:hypothetical protein
MKAVVHDSLCGIVRSPALYPRIILFGDFCVSVGNSGNLSDVTNILEGTIPSNWSKNTYMACRDYQLTFKKFILSNQNYS